MRKLAGACLLSLLFVALGVPVQASVTVRAEIDRSVHVAFVFENINSTIWGEMIYLLGGYLFNASTIPKIIKDSLAQRKLTHVSYYGSHLEINSTVRSMSVTFYLSGSDILSFTFNKKTMAKIYRVRTEWRKFYFNITGWEGHTLLSLNFAEYFDTPVERWHSTNYTLRNEKRLAYYYKYNFTGPNPFDPSCYFILPAAATNISVEGETIAFELPPALEDVLINSPFWIVGTLIIANIAILFYRKMKEGRGTLEAPQPSTPKSRSTKAF